MSLRKRRSSSGSKLICVVGEATVKTDRAGDLDLGAPASVAGARLYLPGGGGGAGATALEDGGGGGNLAGVSPSNRLDVRELLEAISARTTSALINPDGGAMVTGFPRRLARSRSSCSKANFFWCPSVAM